MSVRFDKNGNLIHEIATYKIKHNNLTTELINDSTVKYFCSICDTYHKKKYRGNLNQTFIKHKNNAIEVSDSYVFNKKLSNSFKNYDMNKHKKSSGSNKQ